MKKLLLLFVLVPLPAQAQIPVTDVTALVRLIQIVAQSRTEYTLLTEGYNTVQMMRRGLPTLGQFRLPGIPIGSHNISLYPFGAEILQGMNIGGDPYGNGWYRSSQVLLAAAPFLARLPPEVQAIVRASLATVQLTDSTAIMGANTVGETRVYHQMLQEKIDALQNEVVNSPSEITANIDKLAIAGTIRSRQEMASSQLQSNMVEMLIAKEKQARDAEAENLNMQIRALQDAGEIMQQSVAGSGPVLRNWYPR